MIKLIIIKQNGNIRHTDIHTNKTAGAHSIFTERQGAVWRADELPRARRAIRGDQGGRRRPR